MKIKKLLFVTDFEQLWFDALQSLMDLRKAGLEHVIFLHVIKREKVAFVPYGGYLKGEEAKLREMANIRFIDWAEGLFEAGMECGAYILVGNPVPKVLSVANEEKADLIVTGAHKSTETIEILRRTSIPVLVHKYDIKKHERPFERPILVTKDILKNVVVVHVIPEKSIKGLNRTEIQKIERENKKRLEEVCDVLSTEGISSECHLYIGEVVEQIKNAISEHNVSMVVAGTTGKGAWRARWLGSVSHELVQDLELPILLVPKAS